MASPATRRTNCLESDEDNKSAARVRSMSACVSAGQTEENCCCCRRSQMARINGKVEHVCLNVHQQQQQHQQTDFCHCLERGTSLSSSRTSVAMMALHCTTLVKQQQRTSARSERMMTRRTSVARQRRRRQRPSVSSWLCQAAFLFLGSMLIFTSLDSTAALKPRPKNPHEREETHQVLSFIEPGRLSASKEHVFSRRSKPLEGTSQPLPQRTVRQHGQNVLLRQQPRQYHVGSDGTADDADVEASSSLRHRRVIDARISQLSPSSPAHSSKFVPALSSSSDTLETQHPHGFNRLHQPVVIRKYVVSTTPADNFHTGAKVHSLEHANGHGSNSHHQLTRQYLANKQPSASISFKNKSDHFEEDRIQGNVLGASNKADFRRKSEDLLFLHDKLQLTDVDPNEVTIDEKGNSKTSKEVYFDQLQVIEQLQTSSNVKKVSVVKPDDKASIISHAFQPFSESTGSGTRRHQMERRSGPIRKYFLNRSKENARQDGSERRQLRQRRPKFRKHHPGYLAAGGKRRQETSSDVLNFLDPLNNGKNIHRGQQQEDTAPAGNHHSPTRKPFTKSDLTVFQWFGDFSASPSASSSLLDLPATTYRPPLLIQLPLSPTTSRPPYIPSTTSSTPKPRRTMRRKVLVRRRKLKPSRPRNYLRVNDEHANTHFPDVLVVGRGDNSLEKPTWPLPAPSPSKPAVESILPDVHDSKYWSNNNDIWRPITPIEHHFSHQSPVKPLDVTNLWPTEHIRSHYQAELSYQQHESPNFGDYAHFGPSITQEYNTSLYHHNYPDDHSGQHHVKVNSLPESPTKSSQHQPNQDDDSSWSKEIHEQNVHQHVTSYEKLPHSYGEKLTGGEKASSKDEKPLKVFRHFDDDAAGVNKKGNDLRDWDDDRIPGLAEQDYPTLTSIPKTRFSCLGRAAGMYADQEASCQVWHMCQEDGRLHSFLCPVGTIFDQQKLTCDWWHNVRHRCNNKA